MSTMAAVEPATAGSGTAGSDRAGSGPAGSDTVGPGTAGRDAQERGASERGPAGAESAAQGMTEQEIRRRAARLEERFGDPGDPANPLGFRALLAAEERGELLPEAEQVLDDEGFGAELVPAALGGRLERADGLARILRPIFRRDLALGFGHGITSLFAASAVWVAGTDQQRQEMALLLRAGGRAAIVHHSMAHGVALLSGEATISSRGGGIGLSGRKDMVINAERAGALVVYARNDPDSPRLNGGGSHSVLLMGADEHIDRGLRVLPRRPTTGMQGCRFAGYEFDDCRLAEDAIVGAPGDGVRLALRTFQLNRSLIPAALVGSVDPVLRAAVRTAVAGANDIRAGRQRALLAGVFADLLACDSMATVALRALHLVPDSAHLAAAEVKYLVPDLLRDDLEELGTVLGMSAGCRDGEQGALAKLMRDLPAAGLGHAGTAACQAVVIPQLPLLARKSWFRAAEPPAGLFGLDGMLPRLDLSALALAGGEDVLAAGLVATASRVRDRRIPGEYGRALRTLADGFVTELWALHDRCLAIEPGDRAALSRPEMCAVADRHALLLAAAAVLGVWERQQSVGGFLADPAWAVLALTRLGLRLNMNPPELPEDCVDRVLVEVVDRLRTGRSYDLHDAPMEGGGTW